MPDSGVSSLGVPGMPWHPQILSNQLTLSKPGGTDYAHLITTGTPGFLDLPTALRIGSAPKTRFPSSSFFYYETLPNGTLKKGFFLNLSMDFSSLKPLKLQNLH